MAIAIDYVNENFFLVYDFFEIFILHVLVFNVYTNIYRSVHVATLIYN